MNIGSLPNVVQEGYKPSKGTFAGNFLWKGTTKNPNAGMDKNSIAGLAARGVDKLTRPIIHVVDHISSGVDSIKDTIKGTKTGKKVLNKANEYYNDPKGEHKVASTLLKAGTSYALNRGVSHALDSEDSGLVHAIDTGLGAYSGYKQYKKSDQRSKMSKNELKRAINADNSREARERAERKERMNNFWNDMKF